MSEVASEEVRAAMRSAHDMLLEKGAATAEIIEIMGDFHREYLRMDEAEAIQRLQNRVNDFKPGESVRITEMSS